ncbi:MULTISPECIES: flagellin biosynthesis protein FlgL [unclassified Campylobacter]|uniref:flagellin N-terminal helical domain-containing protein n=1 Tax=unclassified Campylobacter TaxID=2593542 RepID=UPI001BDA8179|nr:MULTISPECIES: flagellin biosynthesis protein FlgL [unclassified Campylobacter]MBT0879996.1 flagellin biosynthesis protein FlgL [Campylobacter sp. 2018MI27]MBT0884471.1 flagellin biosynthesis protein FlgL [Campylobacter sp. 2018MI10]
MRITSSYIYSQNLGNFQRQQNMINDANNQLTSGLKINQSYDDAGIYSEGSRLVYEISTFQQISEAASKAINITKNSDKAVDEMSKALDQFKNKLIQGANEVHSDTSLNALANDLQKIRDHIVNIANTSINGQYLFSGTNVGTKPFDEKGNYYGNDENMQVLLGSNVYNDYNISGQELMKGVDNDYKKIISTNVRLVDRRYDINKPEEVHYITQDSKIKDLIGKEYLKPQANGKELNVNDHFLKNDEGRFPDTYFYVRGTKGNGESFKAKFKMGADEDVGAMFNKIGELYGNTKENKVVDVTLSNNGTIEITDLKNQESRINFSIFAATAKADDFGQIYPPKIPDTPPMPIIPFPVKSELASVTNPNDLRNNNDVFVLEFTNTGNIDTSFTSDGIDYSRSLFSKKDNILSSNIAQVDKNNNVATNETKLVEASQGTLKLNPNDATRPDSVLKLEITSKNKVHYSIDFNITQGTATASYKQNGQDKKVTLPITNVVYDNNQHISDSVKTNPENITYKQLGDIISMFASDNIPTKDYQLVPKYPNQANSPMILNNDDKAELERLLINSKNSVDVGLNEKGQMTLIDKGATTTKIDLAIFDANTMNKDEFDFGVDANGVAITEGSKKGDLFNFNTNSTLIVDEGRVDIIKDLDKMIEAVRNGNYRADSNNPELLKSVGIQGALKRIDHLQDHINKVHTKIGATQTSIQNSQDRADLMKVNVEQVKAKVLNSDPVESQLMLMQATITLQATLQASAQVSKLSLLNYM